jgi:adenylate kinase
MSRLDREPQISERDRANFTLVTGVPGAGKNHNLKLAQQRGMIPSNVRIVGLGDLLRNELRRDGVQVASKDAIRTLDPQVVDLGIRKVVHDVVERAADSQNPHIIIGHLVYKQGDELVSLLDLYQEFGDQIRGVIDVMGYPEDIYDQRRKGTRNRLLETPDQIAIHQNVVFDASVRLGTRDIEVRPVMSRPRQDEINLLHMVDAIEDLIR